MERWKPVVGYEGLYEISDCGNIRSLIQNPPRLLKPATGTSGYKYVQLTKEITERRTLPKQIHRLVIEAFDGELPKGIEVNHRNGKKTDNRLSNLEKATRSENIRHRIRVLGIKPIVRRGIHHGLSKFTEEEVRAIRTAYSKGMSVKRISACFNDERRRTSKSAIWHIVKRRSWNHI